MKLATNSAANILNVPRCDANNAASHLERRTVKSAVFRVEFDLPDLRVTKRSVWVTPHKVLVQNVNGVQY